jgi:hypothetical protein
MTMKFYGSFGNQYRYNKFGDKVPLAQPSPPPIVSDKKEIKVYVREVYGNTLVYPVCTKALAFAKIAGTKTLLPNALASIEELGYTVHWVSRQEV